MLSTKDKKRISDLSELIYLASKEVKILKHISWSENVRIDFFKNNCNKIPDVTYPKYDDSDLVFLLKEAGKLFGDTKYDVWLKDKVKEIKRSSELLSVCGTRDFFKVSSDIYGLPSTPIHDKTTMPRDLSRQFEEIINSINSNQIMQMHSGKLNSETVAKGITKSVDAFFGESAPKIKLVQGLSAKATASSKTIKIRENGEFDQTDVRQLLNHEAYIHVATTLNGRGQEKMKILGSNYGSITKTQEGLAVFSEYITGSIDVDRMRRISDRVLAIQMAIDGADFIEVFKYFVKKDNSKNQAFESTRRVFRGGLLTGGAPFTKDIVYLDGLIRVYNFFRSAISQGKTECIELLFSGKIDIDDIPIVYSLYKEGLVEKPQFIPPWAVDLNYLICFFSFSVFLEDVNYDNVTNYYESLLKGVD